MVVIAVPSYKREQWLYDVYLHNIYKYLLKPMGGQIKLVLFIQGSNSTWQAKLSKKVLKMRHIKLVFTTALPGFSIGQIRHLSFLAAMNHFPEAEFVLAQDDDMFLTRPKGFSESTLQYEYSRLLGEIKPGNTYCLYPGKEYTIEPYVHPKTIRSFYLPCYLRGHLYPVEALKELDFDKLAAITVGEDYSLPRIINRPIYWVTGFDGHLHLCSRTIYNRGVLRKNYQFSLREECTYAWNRYKVQYDFDGTGYDPLKASIGFEGYHKIYPEYFTKEGYYI